jgi:hypothetical protein
VVSLQEVRPEMVRIGQTWADWRAKLISPNSKVTLCNGRTGTVTKVVPDPCGHGRDMFIVVLDRTDRHIESAWVYREHLRPAPANYPSAFLPTTHC